MVPTSVAVRGPAVSAVVTRRAVFALCAQRELGVHKAVDAVVPACLRRRDLARAGQVVVDPRRAVDAGVQQDAAYRVVGQVIAAAGDAVAHVVLQKRFHAHELPRWRLRPPARGRAGRAG